MTIKSHNHRAKMLHSWLQRILALHSNPKVFSRRTRNIGAIKLNVMADKNSGSKGTACFIQFTTTATDT